MSLPYKKTLIVGATSGIGWSLAARFVENGISVVVVGRRKDKLNEFVQQYGGNSSQATVDSAVLDITDLRSIPKFAEDVLAKHPDIDCVLLNSGIQRANSWVEPEKFNLETMELEMLTNYTSYMYLVKAFLPHLQKQAPKPTSLIFTTSGIALIPVTFCPNYGASKAALHHMILAMREQLRETHPTVKVVEIYPPAVQTELHDFEMGSEKGSHIGMPLQEFTDEAWEGLCKEGLDGEQVPVQAVKTFMGFESWERERQNVMFKLNELMRKNEL